MNEPRRLRARRLGGCDRAGALRPEGCIRPGAEDDTVHEDVAMGVTNNGPEEVRAFAQAFVDAVPDFDVVLRSSSGDDRSAVGEWEMSGTQTGDLPGMPASGRPFRVRGATLITLDDAGRVSRWTEYWDTAIWLRQLGFLAA